MATDEFRASESSDADVIEDLLDEWEAAVSHGESPLPHEICREHPHLLPEFIQKTRMLSKVDQNLNHEATERQDLEARSPEPAPCDELDWTSDVARLTYHAHGGLGIVFRGFDQKLHRDLAIKFIRERRRTNPIDVQRFRVEAEITSRLDHPGVAPVHGYGLTESGVPFYAMRMVEGQTLQECIDDFHTRFSQKDKHPGGQSLEFRKLLTSFISVCKTIEYAHTRGVINCDIKPGNVMLGKYGETVVLDWGCAKYVGSEGRAESVGEESLKPLSDTGDSASEYATGGTPIYMSPEQHAHADDVGPLSDIYGLGVTLYRLITGQPAFRPDNGLAKVREQVLRGRFRKPTDVCPWISKALEAICLKAMSLAPDDRYQSPGELAAELERYLGDEEVGAYVEPLSRRLARLMRRHRGVSNVIMVSTVVLILFSSIFAVMMGQLATRETVARQQATELRNHSLQLAARSAATSMALKINDAWRILEIESNSQLLINQMIEEGNATENPDWSRLQKWLLLRAAEHETATRASSWFLCNAEGKQIARSPLYDEEEEIYQSIGKNYAHRDYFHGNGRDLMVGEVGSPPHVTDIHLSAVYQSSNTSDLKVAFSIPVWSDRQQGIEREFLGVLGFSVELGRFAVLRDESEGQLREEISVLVDLRNHGKNGNFLYGTILQHPALNKTLLEENPQLQDLPKVKDEYLDVIEAHRQKRVEQIHDSGFAAPTTDVLLINNYSDPFDKADSVSYIAACEPVCVVGRPARSFNTGWLVIVQGVSDAD